jgi:hypothetical protein
MDIVKEVVRLKNIEAIRTLIAKYALAADAYSPPDMMRPLFSRSAGWHCAVLGAHYDGLDAVTKGLAQVRERAVLWTMHFNVAPLIEISDDGTTGTAFWYPVGTRPHQYGWWHRTAEHLDSRFVPGSRAARGRHLALRPDGPEPAPRRTGGRTGLAG